jgi:hypothetical protein
MNSQDEAFLDCLKTYLLIRIKSRRSPSNCVEAARLARLIEDDETGEWLRYELNGYEETGIGHRYITSNRPMD